MLPGLFLGFLLGFLGFLGTAATGGFAFAGDACTIATSGDSQPAKACAKGGRPEAKKVMKAMVAAANTSGGKFKCLDCHQDIDDYQLTKIAKADYAKLVALLAKK